MTSIGRNITWINLPISASVHLNVSSTDVSSVVVLDEFKSSSKLVPEQLMITSVSIFTMYLENLIFIFLLVKHLLLFIRLSVESGFVKVSKGFEIPNSSVFSCFWICTNKAGFQSSEQFSFRCCIQQDIRMNTERAMSI